MQEIGDVKTLTATFRNSAGDPTDPTTVTFKLWRPEDPQDTPSVVYVFGTDPELTNSGVGVYEVDWTWDRNNIHRHQFIGTGTVAATEKGEHAIGWLDEDDLATFLVDAGVLSAAPSPIPGHYGRRIVAAAHEIDRYLEWNPYLALGVDQARYFDPPGAYARRNTAGGGARLELDGGLISLTELRIGVSDTDPDGTLLTVNEDFELRPYNGPKDWIEFKWPQRGSRKSIKVIGEWGKVTALSYEIQQAQLEMAGAMFLRDRKAAQALNPVEWHSQAGISERYSIELLKELGEDWEKSARDRIRGEKRMVMGI